MKLKLTITNMGNKTLKPSTDFERKITYFSTLILYVSYLKIKFPASYSMTLSVIINAVEKGAIMMRLIRKETRSATNTGTVERQ